MATLMRKPVIQRISILFYEFKQDGSMNLMQEINLALLISEGFFTVIVESWRSCSA